MKIIHSILVVLALTTLASAHADSNPGDGALNPAPGAATANQPGPNKNSYPPHWGEPPRVQTRDLRPLPGGYGMGSSTLKNWIQKNLDQDAKDATPSEQQPTPSTAQAEEIRQLEKKIAELEDFATRARFTEEGYKKFQDELAALKERLKVLKGDARSGSDALKPPMPAATDPVIKAGEKVTLTGKLHGGIMAIGGETTGWELTYPTSKGKGKLEVDMAAIKNPEALDGKEVTITGSIISKPYVERGAVLILKAETVRQPRNKGG